MDKAQLRERNKEAHVLTQQGNKAEAQKILYEVLAVDSENITAKILLSRIVPKSEGIRLVKEVLAKNPDNQTAQKQLANLTQKSARPPTESVSRAASGISIGKLLGLITSYVVLFAVSVGGTVAVLQFNPAPGGFQTQGRVNRNAVDINGEPLIPVTAVYSSDEFGINGTFDIDLPLGVYRVTIQTEGALEISYSGMSGCRELLYNVGSLRFPVAEGIATDGVQTLVSINGECDNVQVVDATAAWEITFEQIAAHEDPEWFLSDLVLIDQRATQTLRFPQVIDHTFAEDERQLGVIGPFELPVGSYETIINTS
ncbi:MAG: hypothetical protein AAFV98_19290 [Chloroflexota bacterium]